MTADQLAANMQWFRNSLWAMANRLEEQGGKYNTKAAAMLEGLGYELDHALGSPDTDAIILAVRDTVERNWINA